MDSYLVRTGAIKRVVQAETHLAAMAKAAMEVIAELGEQALTHTYFRACLAPKPSRNNEYRYSDRDHVFEAAGLLPEGTARERLLERIGKRK